MNLSQRDLEQFDSHLDELEAQYGIQLDDDDRLALLDESVRNGFTADVTERLVADFADTLDEDYDDWDDEDWEDDMDHAEAYERAHDIMPAFKAAAFELETSLNRPLDRAELEAAGRVVDGGEITAGRMREALNEHYASSGSNVRLGESRAYDLSSEGDRLDFTAERFGAEEVTPERPLHLDETNDRVDFMAARLRGEEFEDAWSDE